MDLPLCKYGENCYRKNPTHFQQFSHGPTRLKRTAEDNNKTETQDESRIKKQVKLDEDDEKETQPDENKEKTDTFKEHAVVSKNNNNREELEYHMENLKDLYTIDQRNQICKEDRLQLAYHMPFPEDFFQMYDLLVSISPSDPLYAFYEVFGIVFVGPFEILHTYVSRNDQVLSKVIPLLNWRYFYDTAEFLTLMVLVKSARKHDKIAFDSKEALEHWGYFRDEPKKMPKFVASNSAESCDCYFCGDNIFAALYKFGSTLPKKQASNILSEISKFCDKKKIAIHPLRQVAWKKRKKEIVAQTLTKAGIVVFVDKAGFGYRDLQEDDDTYITIFEEIQKEYDQNGGKTPDSFKTRWYPRLEDSLHNLNFAFDEGDFGAGLHMGINMFCSGQPFLNKEIKRLLKLAYSLLRRDIYADIVIAHLLTR